MAEHRYLGEILIDEGLLSPADLEEALGHQKRHLGEILVELGKVRPEDVDRCLQLQTRGRTRAQRYQAYMRAALLAAGLASLVAGLAVWSLLRDMHGREALDRARLPGEAIAAILESGSVGQRMDALRSVSSLPRQEDQVAMLRKAMQDPGWTVRLLAAVTARALKLEGSVPDLIPLMLDEEQAVRDEARRVLRDLTGARPGREFEDWYKWGKAQGLTIVQPERLRRPR